LEANAVTPDTKTENREIDTSENIESFFRQCPNCGKRFEVKIVGKKLVESESIKENRPVNSDYFGGYTGSILTVGQEEPTVVDVEKFQYTYRCKNCGHLWREFKEEDSKS
jgi:predicted RNA-binding Zn-ribbon protein involved in translation (DUF1610 family)